MKKCPACNYHMETMRVGDVIVERCTKCSGIWFDQGEANKVFDKKLIHETAFIVNRSREDFKNCRICRRENEGKNELCEFCNSYLGNLSCLNCKGKMTEHVFTNIYIDYCQTCGALWVDKIELLSLAKPFIRRESTPAERDQSGMDPLLDEKQHIPYMECFLIAVNKQLKKQVNKVTKSVEKWADESAEFILNNFEKGYTPVSKEMVKDLRIYAERKRILIVRYAERKDSIRIISIMPKEIIIENGAEYLKGIEIETGEFWDLRLDRIIDYKKYMVVDG